MSEIIKVKKVFRQWDTEGNGFIMRDKLCAVFKCLDSAMSNTEEDLYRLMDQYATGPNGSIRFDDFLDNLWSDAGPPCTADAKGLHVAELPDANTKLLKGAFSKIDANGDGSISILEFTKFLRQVQDRMLPYKVINTLFHRSDIDANSQLVFGEFCILAAALKSGTLEGFPATDVVELSQNMTPISKLKSVNSSSGTVGSVKLNSPRFGMIELSLNVGTPASVDAEDLKNCFTKIDKDKDGFISILEFTKLLRKAGGKMLPHAILNKIFRKSDTNNDTKLDFAEFCQLVEVLKSGSLGEFPAIDVVEVSRKMASD